MKTAAILLVILALILGSVLCYGLFNTTLQITGKNLQTFSAAERIAEFSTLQAAVEQRSVIGTVLQDQPLEAAENYRYYVYTLRVKNKGLVDAEMVEMQIAPIAQDILYYGPTEEIIIRPGETRDIWCTLLTREATHAVRDLHVTYYLWGHPHEVKYTYDQSY